MSQAFTQLQQILFDMFILYDFQLHLVAIMCYFTCNVLIWKKTALWPQDEGDNYRKYRQNTGTFDIAGQMLVAFG